MTDQTTKPTSTSASTSINFVVSAIYTVTFANAIYQVVDFDGTAVSLEVRADAPPAVLACAGMCMVMALRFFFGNNNFMDAVFVSSSGPLVRFYHLAVTVFQSLILLGSSYLVRNPTEFIKWLAALFAAELAWYCGCLIFARTAVTGENGKLDRRLLVNETANLLMAGGAVVTLLAAEDRPNVSVWIVAALFVLNTAIDLKNNLGSYMGI